MGRSAARMKSQSELNVGHCLRARKEGPFVLSGRMSCGTADHLARVRMARFKIVHTYLGGEV